MDTPGFLGLKNKMCIAAWQWRWALQGGSHHWAARPLRDLRSDEDLRRYRVIELKRRHTPFGRRVVNLNAFRFERIRQQAYKRMAVS
jgi:hypothetical protein